MHYCEAIINKEIRQMYKLLVTDNCHQCKVVKDNLPYDIYMDILIVDALSPEGIAEMAYHGLQSVPALITPKDTTIQGTTEIITELKERICTRPPQP